MSPINLQAEAFESKIGNISAGSTKSAFHLSGILGKALDRKSNLRAGAIEVSQLPQELKTIVAEATAIRMVCWMKSMPLWNTLVTTN